MNTIVYLGEAKVSLLPEAAIPQLYVNVPTSEYSVEVYPTKCKVTINGNIVFEDVYVAQHKDGIYSLYKSYCVMKTYIPMYSGHGMTEREACYLNILGKDLVLQFKSDNFVIEAL
jgi:hypothetical protein